MQSPPDLTISDAPLTSRQDDLFGRGQFARAIVDMLVTKREPEPSGSPRYVASNSVVGLNGPWGSGKSTIVNFVEEMLSEIDPIIIIRFVPWMVSNDLDSVKYFFSLVTSAIDERLSSASAEARKLKSAFARYATAGGWLASAATGVPGLGQLADALVREEKLGIGSLAKQKKELETALLDADIPLVILLDELDRLEDIEIRNIMRLIKSILDVQGISFLLAYDFERVVEALRQTGAAGSSERGVRYLEKIVNINVQVPILLHSERRERLNSYIKSKEVELGTRFRNKKQRTYYGNLLDILFFGLMQTPRDMKRLISTFEYYMKFKGSKLSWIDILAYSALCCKAPNVVQKMFNHPNELTSGEEKEYDPVFAAQRLDYCDHQLAERYGYTFNNKAEANLFAFLFDRFTSTAINHQFGPERLALSRNLAQVMRPGTGQPDQEPARPARP